MMKIVMNPWLLKIFFDKLHESFEEKKFKKFSDLTKHTN